MSNPEQPVVPGMRQRRKQARPAELLAAALEEFVARGYAATRLEEVAARAGVSKGTLYLYFGSKETLFKAVIEQGILPVLEQGETLLSQHEGDARALLRLIVLRWWELIGTTSLSGIPKLMFAEAGNFPETARYYYEHVIQRGRTLMRAVLARGVAEGVFHVDDPETTIDLIYAPMLMLTVWRHSLAPCGCGKQDPVVYLETHIQMLLKGLSATEKKS